MLTFKPLASPGRVPIPDDNYNVWMRNDLLLSTTFLLFFPSLATSASRSNTNDVCWCCACLFTFLLAHSLKKSWIHYSTFIHSFIKPFLCVWARDWLSLIEYSLMNKRNIWKSDILKILLACLPDCIATYLSIQIKTEKLSKQKRKIKKLQGFSNILLSLSLLCRLPLEKFA